MGHFVDFAGEERRYYLLLVQDEHVNMTQFLPPNLLALFAPRDPIPYFPPLDKLRTEKPPIKFGGLAGYLHLLEV